MSFQLKYILGMMIVLTVLQPIVYLGTNRVSFESKRQALDIEKCFFCEKGHDEGDLHQVSTFDTDASLRHMITELLDIIVGDLIA